MQDLEFVNHARPLGPRNVTAFENEPHPGGVETHDSLRGHRGEVDERGPQVGREDVEYLPVPGKKLVKGARDRARRAVR